MKLVLLSVFLAGCIPAGSPRINITKNVYVYESCNTYIGYSTESSTTSDADIVQELEELLKIPVDQQRDSYLPKDTIEALREYKVSLKGNK